MTNGTGTPINGITISPVQFGVVLLAHKSPVLDAKAAFDICVVWKIDPAFMLAIFVMESSCGTRGAAVPDLNWGNVRSGKSAMRKRYAGVSGTFAVYSNWYSSLDDACRIINSYPCPKMVESVLSIYAPSSQNVTSNYIALVKQMMARWASERS